MSSVQTRYRLIISLVSVNCAWNDYIWSVFTVFPGRIVICVIPIQLQEWTPVFRVLTERTPNIWQEEALLSCRQLHWGAVFIPEKTSIKATKTGAHEVLFLSFYVRNLIFNSLFDTKFLSSTGKKGFSKAIVNRLYDLQNSKRLINELKLLSTCWKNWHEYTCHRQRIILIYRRRTIFTRIWCESGF